jgi:selenium metabolism protein YedF
LTDEIPEGNVAKVLMIKSDCMGVGEDELGAKLIKAFFLKLAAAETKPDVIVFYNTGVKLVCNGSEVLDSLELLAQAGVDLPACGTCLAHFELTDKLRVGRRSNMQEIVDLLMKSERVITL